LIIIFVRAIVLYLIIIFGIRLMGKRQIGEFQPSELVITILISNIATLPIEDINIPMILGAVPILALVSFELILSNLTLKNKKLRDLVSGHAFYVIRNGEIDQMALKELRFSVDDLMESLRGQNIFDIKDVNFAIVETTGKISVLPKSISQPPSAQNLNVKTTDAPPPSVLISDGKVVKNSIEQLELGVGWLEKTLKLENLDIKDVFMMTCNSQKDYLIVPKQKKNPPNNNVRQV
jgi:uncharacterized membrane protein YcaP (DUF421 family)